MRKETETIKLEILQFRNESLFLMTVLFGVTLFSVIFGSLIITLHCVLLLFFVNYAGKNIMKTKIQEYTDLYVQETLGDDYAI